MMTILDATLLVAGVAVMTTWYAAHKRRLMLDAAESMLSHTMRLQELTAALSEARTEEEVAEVLLAKGLGVVEAIRGVVARVDGERFEILRARGYQPDVETRLRELTHDIESPISVAVTSGEPVWFASVEAQRARFPHVHQHLGIPVPPASVCAPLRYRGETVGALVMIFADSSAFGAAKRAFTLMLAQAAADALLRARSYDVERAARQGAETLAQARADVLGIVAHDLRNPLNLIMSSTSSVLELAELSAEQRRKMLEITLRATRRMNRLIADLLDATRLQAGRLSLDLADIDAARIVREADEAFVAAACERHIELRALAPVSECWVRADEGRLLQVIGNLVGNALKFTPEGGRVTLTAENAGPEVIFRVTDTGPGIPEEARTHLFETFWQARSNDQRGVGLGLSITKGIVGAHGGRLWVESTVGVGSSFSFALSASRDADSVRRPQILGRSPAAVQRVAAS